MPNRENQRLHEAHQRLLELASQSETGQPVRVPDDLAEDPAVQPEIFGPYALQGRLGHGGQGVVYLAVDTRLGREVALKLLSAGGGMTPAGRARFEREATSASRLRHPGICVVHEAGEIEGQCFLAMELVDGESLPEWIARTTSESGSSDSGSRRRRVDRALEIVEQIARAVHAAHEAGVVHRDLKPSNVMLRRDGSPVVLDFGLARDASAEGATLTAQGDVLGTPAYMPPERIRGTGGGADPREDVYGIGAILFECLTGERPFGGHTREEVYRRILTEPVANPTRSNPAVPHEARFVVETALDKVADRRYATAAELADDLQRLRNREPIHARPVPGWLRLARWIQRNPRTAVPTVAAFAVLLIGIALSWALIAARGEALEDARARLLIGDSTRSLRTDVQRALRQARDAYALRQNAETRSQLYEVLAQTREISSFDPKAWNQPNKAFLVADDQRILVVRRRVLGLYDLGGATVAETRLPRGGQTQSASLNRDRDHVVVAGKDGVARVYTTHGLQLVAELANASPLWVYGEAVLVALVRFSPTDPKTVLTAAQGGAALWHLDGQRRPEAVWREPKSDPTAKTCCVAFSADGSRFATGDTAGKVRVYRSEGDGPVLSHTFEQPGMVNTIAFDPTRPVVVFGGVGDGCVRFRALDGGANGVLTTVGKAVAHVGFSPPHVSERSSWLAACDNNRAAHVWRSTENPGFELVQRITDHAGDVIGTEFSPDGRWILTFSRDATARLVEVGGATVAIYRAGRTMVASANFSPDGSRVLTLTRGSVRVWRATDPVFRVLRHSATVTSLEISDRHVVAVLRTGNAVLHERDTGRSHALETGIRGMAMPSAISPDGARLAIGGPQDGRVCTWDLESTVPHRRTPDLVFAGRLLQDLAFDPHGGYDLAVAAKPRTQPGGVWLIDAAGTKTRIVEGWCVRLDWCSPGRIVGLANNHVFVDLLKGEKLTSHPSERQVNGIAASPDGRFIASASGSGRIRILDTRRTPKERLVHDFQAHDAWTRGLAFSPDGLRLVTASRDGTARIWDVRTGTLWAELRGHRGGVIVCKFSPDGQQIVTGGTDGTVRFWPADFAEVERLAEARQVR